MSAPLTPDERAFLERCVEVWEEVAREWDGPVSVKTCRGLYLTVTHTSHIEINTRTGRVPAFWWQVSVSHPPNVGDALWYPPGKARRKRARHARLLAVRCRQLLTMEHPV